MKLTKEQRDVADFVSRECRRQKVTLWGQPRFVTPRLVEWVHGDGLQVIYFTPLATRPNYYVVRIDSKIDLSNHSRENVCFADQVLDELCDEIENQFGSYYEEWEHDNGRTYKRHNRWPALDYTCGGAWGQLLARTGRSGA